MAGSRHVWKTITLDPRSGTARGITRFQALVHECAAAQAMSREPSPHEIVALLLQGLEELKAEIWKAPGDRSPRMILQSMVRLSALLDGGAVALDLVREAPRQVECERCKYRGFEFAGRVRATKEEALARYPEKPRSGSSPPRLCPGSPEPVLFPAPVSARRGDLVTLPFAVENEIVCPSCKGPCCLQVENCDDYGVPAPSSKIHCLGQLDGLSESCASVIGEELHGEAAEAAQRRAVEWARVNVRVV